MENIVVGKNIIKSYGNGVEQTKALDMVNVEIGKGEFVAVMGSSGSGKSTLLFMLSGMDDISAGSVKFRDTELSILREDELADVRRKKMGFIFQQPTMLKNLNIMDNILLPAYVKSKKDNEKIKQRAKLLMKKTGIEGLENRDITEVSGGQLQRAGICRALINEPEIIFADEPTGALNSKSADEVMKLLLEINKGGTSILLVTHDAKIAACADRILFTKDGKISTELLLQNCCEMGIEARTEKVHAQMVAVGV